MIGSCETSLSNFLPSIEADLRQHGAEDGSAGASRSTARRTSRDAARHDRKAYPAARNRLWIALRRRKASETGRQAAPLTGNNPEQRSGRTTTCSSQFL